MEGPPAADARDLLNGWKEIASYVGRSTRSVQRWERDLGLPVHRIATPEGGAVVYALRTEVDAWRTASGVAGSLGTGPAREVDPNQPSGPLPAGDQPADRPDPASPATRGWGARLMAPVPVWIVLILMGLTAVTTLYIQEGQRASVVAATWEFDGRQLHGFSDGGRLLWTHVFDRVVSRPTTFVRGLGEHADVDGDGQLEMLVPVRFTTTHATTAETDAVIAFGSRGSVVWSVQPEVQLRAGDEVFEGPWQVFDIATGLTPDGPRTWVAYSHHTWWPAFVLEIAPDGTSRIQYVQSGRIHSLTYWQAGDTRLLVAGGTLREPARASAAFMPLDGRAYRWPAEGDGSLQCDGCPNQPPAAVMAFPTSEVTERLFRPYGWVIRGRVVPAGLDLIINDGFGQGTMASVSADLNVIGLERSDRYWQVHRDLESQGRIAHAADNCPERTDLLEVLKWEPLAGWTTSPIRPHAVGVSSPDTE